MNAPAPGREFDPLRAEGYERIHLIQGECRVSGDAQVVLTTTLGSCIAACLYDPDAGVGGMNHFLLPDSDGGGSSVSLRYGAYAMELLVNALLRLGATRRGLRAKLFGGARLAEGLMDVGARNAAFAEEFVRREGLVYEGGSLRGLQARKVQFWPATGRARQRLLTKPPALLPARALLPDEHGELELF